MLLIMELGDPSQLPPELPAPADDGAAGGIEGSAIPAIRLASTVEAEIEPDLVLDDLAALLEIRA